MFLCAHFPRQTNRPNNWLDLDKETEILVDVLFMNQANFGRGHWSEVITSLLFPSIYLAYCIVNIGEILTYRSMICCKFRDLQLHRERLE